MHGCRSAPPPGAVQPVALCLRRGRQAATQFAGTFDPDKPPVADDEEPGLEATGLYSPTQATFANGMHYSDRRNRSGDRRDPHPALLRHPRLRHHGQPDDRRGPGSRRRGPGRRWRALRAHGLRRVRGSCSNAASWTSSFPMPPRCRNVEADHLETPSPLNPQGIKGAGEAGCIPVTAVIASAIEDAEGFPITAMPISRRTVGVAATPRAGERLPRCVVARPLAGKGADMKISGAHTFNARRQGVGGLHGPGRAARVLPGCESLSETRPDACHAGDHRVSPLVKRGRMTARSRSQTRSSPVRS